MVSSPHDLIQYVHSNCLFVQKKAPQNLHLRDKEKSIFENPKNLRICSYSYALVCSSFESPHDLSICIALDKDFCSTFKPCYLGLK